MDICEALLRNTIIFNSIGLPAISIPLDFTREKDMPVGLQLVGPPYGDNLVLSIAYLFECTRNEIFKFIPPNTI